MSPPRRRAPAKGKPGREPRTNGGSPASGKAAPPAGGPLTPEEVNGVAQLQAPRENLGVAYPALVRKYAELQQKHARLVEHLRDRTTESVSLVALSSWALETHASGLVLISDGHIRVSNPRWDALTHLGPEKRVWCQLDTEGEPVGRSYPSLREAALNEAERVLIAEPRSVRTTRFSPQGSPETVELRVEHVLQREGKHVAVMLAHDVTAQHAAERELRQVRETTATRERMRALGEVVGGVTHDLNNVLQAMRLRLQLLQSDAAVQAAQGPALATLLQIVQDAAGRVDRLHDFARRKAPSAPVPVDLRQVVREAVELVGSDFSTVAASDGGNPIEVETVLPEQLPRVRGWQGELRYVLLNLLLNARDAMPRGGLVRVGAEERVGQVLLWVEDTGTGILPQHLTRIFEPLFTTKRERNSGLGLSMAYGVMERLGGSIRALNRTEGGARFELLFPTAPPPSSGRGPG